MKALLLILLISCGFYSCFGQKIVAPSIAEWQSNVALGPDYKYNSVSVFLLNGEKLPGLFSGASLTQQERKQIKLRPADYPKYLYFYVGLPEPKNPTTELTYPLYFIDATNKNNISYSEGYQGKVLDELSDDVLGSKSIIASGKMKVIKNNSNAEFITEALKISNDVLTTTAALAKGPLGTPAILEALGKSNQYFQKLTVDRTVSNDFPIPILKNESPNYSYTVVSASLQQVKWEFTDNEINPWSAFAANTVLSKDKLVAPIARTNPYLLVVRWKSKYVLPPDWRNKIEFNQEYITKRSDKIDLLPGNAQTREHELMNVLSRSMKLLRDLEIYTESKSSSKVDLVALDRIINSYYFMRGRYNNEYNTSSTSAEEKTYFTNNYATAYQQIFTEIDRKLNTALLDAVPLFVNELGNVSRMSAASLGTTQEIALTGYIDQLHFYRQLSPKMNPAGDAPVGESLVIYINNAAALSKVEAELFRRIRALAVRGQRDTQKEKEYYSSIAKQYPNCEYCKQEAAKEVTAINGREVALINAAKDKEARRAELSKMKTAHTSAVGCFSSNMKVAREGFSKRFPDEATVSKDDAPFFTQCKKQLDQLAELSTKGDFINSLTVETLPDAEVNKHLNDYQLNARMFDNALLSLKQAKLFDEVACK